MQKKIKVLMFIDALVAGGKERRLVELLKGVSKSENIECEVAVMNEEIHYGEIHNLNIKIHYLLRRIKKDPLIFIKLFQLCRTFKPDILHVWDPMTAFYGTSVAVLLRIKLINSMITHASPVAYRSMKLRTQMFHFFSDVMLANSYAGLEVHNIKDKKAVVVHNGFDFSRMNNLSSTNIVREKFGFGDKKIVGMVAAFSEFKDYKTFILSANEVLSKRDDVIFACVGDGEKLEECKSLVQVEHKSKIIFTGKQKNVEEIVNVFDVGVLSTFTEGISNSIMEYMAMSKPVIVTDGGGSSELVEHNITGFLIEQGNHLEMAEKINYLLNTPDRAKEMGRKGREKLENEFDLNKMVEKTFTLYSHLVIP